MTYLSFLDFLIIGFLALPAAFTLTPLWFEQGDGQIKGEELPSDVSILNPILFWSLHQQTYQ